jgi:hypothetical protein
VCSSQATAYPHNVNTHNVKARNVKARNVKAQNVKSIEETHNKKANTKTQKANETMKLTLNPTTI